MSQDTTQNLTGHTTTFWNLLSSHCVLIPAIQRDYVQGRGGDSQAMEARRGMLDDIEAHMHTREPMSLNFIYGETPAPSAKHAAQNQQEWQPIDGQQRLTTLYLVHWLTLANHAGTMQRRKALEAAQTLSRFSYETRSTSRDFFMKLSDMGTIAEVSRWIGKREPGEKLSSFLTDKSWFRPDYLSDPTVIGVLNVLDDIDQRAITDAPDAWQLLTGDNCPLQFEWLDVEDIGNGDDLYIKMNARGKQLSSFENLKSEIEERSSGWLDGQALRALGCSFDQKWADFFWRLAVKDAGGSPAYETRFMTFLNWFFWNQWAHLAADAHVINTEYSMDNSILADTTNRRLADYDVELPEGQHTFCAMTLDRLIRFLDYVYRDDALKEIIDIVRTVSTPASPISYDQRMRLEAAVAYIEGVDEPDEESWNAWIRVIDHLSKAATMWQGYNSIGQYAHSVEVVERYRLHAKNLTEFLATMPAIRGFTPVEQTDEEELKAWLLTNTPAWRNVIYQAESMPYFEGKIGFLLDFVDIGKDTVKYQTQLPDVLEHFKRYLSLTEILLGDAKTNPNQELLACFRRALLTKGDYSLEIKQVRSYAIEEGVEERTCGWRNLLRSTNRERLVRALYDDVLDRLGNACPGRNELIAVLTAIADEYEWDTSREDWHARYLIGSRTIWSHSYFGKLWQYRCKAGICYLPSGTNRVVGGLNRELVTSLMHTALYEDDPDWEVTEVRGFIHHTEDEPLRPYLESPRRAIRIGRIYQVEGESPVIAIEEMIDDRCSEFTDITAALDHLLGPGPSPRQDDFPKLS